jgi:hypothetical protein
MNTFNPFLFDYPVALSRSQRVRTATPQQIALRLAVDGRTHPRRPRHRWSTRRSRNVSVG